MKYYLEKVGIENKEILYRLLQYSLFEESATDLNEMNNDGLFEYKWFDSYFKDYDREAFFIKEDITNKLLGFVMINNHVSKFEEGHSISEFMVIPKYRRQKIGYIIANMCFNMHQGNWEVAPSYGSIQAYSFWKKVIDEYTNGEYDFSDGIFMFKVKQDARVK